MYARARSRRALKQARPKEALAVIQHTIRKIQAINDRFEQEDDENSMELTVLRALAREIRTLVPNSAFDETDILFPPEEQFEILFLPTTIRLAQSTSASYKIKIVRS